jgi:hypothetical protein
MVTGESPNQQDGRCECGSRNRQEEDEALGAGGRSQLQTSSLARGINGKFTNMVILASNIGEFGHKAIEG